MSKCPYCDYEFHIEDFFHITTKETKKGKIRKNVGDFKGEEIEKSVFVGSTGVSRIWACPSCEKVLTITDFAYNWGS